MLEKESKALVITSEAVSHITVAWNKTVEALLETSSLLVSYSQQGNWRSIKLELESRGIMGSSVISMMLGIGNNVYLRNPEVKMLLPPSYGALYQLSKLDDDVIDVKIKNAELSPALTVEQARAWARPAGRITRPPIDQITLSMPYGMDPADKAALISDLDLLLVKYAGVTLK